MVNNNKSKVLPSTPTNNNLNNKLSQQQQQQQIIVSIDLGNTNTCIAITRVKSNNNIIKDEPQIEIISNPQGNRQTPTTLSYDIDNNNELLHGEQTSYKKPADVYNSLKALLGYKIEQINKQYNDILDYNIYDNNNNIIVKTNDDKQYNINELIISYINIVKNEIQQYVGSSIDKILISISEEYTAEQSKLYSNLYQQCNLTVLQSHNDSIAACIAYDIEKRSNNDNIYVIVIDISHIAARYTLVKVENGLYRIINTITYNILYNNNNDNDNILCGYNIDKKLIEYYAVEINKKFKTQVIDINNIHSKPYTKLKKSLINAKHILSTSQTTSIDIDSLYDGRDYNNNITRSKFESIIQPLLSHIQISINNLLAKSYITTDDIDNIILIGGSNKIPLIQTTIDNILSNITILNDITTDECIVTGLAKQASYIGHYNIDEINNHNIKQYITLSLPIGIETYNKLYHIILPINTQLPVSTTLTTTTAIDDQQTVQITLYEGLDNIANKNHQLVTFILTNIPKLKAGLPRIVININIDINGYITGNAHEHNTNTTLNVTNANTNKRYTIEQVNTYMKSYNNNSNNSNKQLQTNANQLLQLSTLYNRLASVAYDSDNHNNHDYNDDIHILQTVQQYIQSVNDIKNIDATQLQQHMNNIQTVYSKYFNRQRSKSTRKSSYKPNGHNNNEPLAAHDDID